MGTTPLPWWGTFICAGLGACTAELATLPVDTTKVRLQLYARHGGAAAAVPGMLTVMRTIARDEGPAALYKGFWPAIHRQLLFASLRVGLYGQISALFRKPGETTVPLSTKVLSGLAAGAIGITIATVRCARRRGTRDTRARRARASALAHAQRAPCSMPQRTCVRD